MSGALFHNRETSFKVGTVNVTALKNRENELIEVAKEYNLALCGISSTKLKGQGDNILRDDWHLYYSGVKPEEFAKSGVAVLVSPNFVNFVKEWIPYSDRVAVLRLGLSQISMAVIVVYAPNYANTYPDFLRDLEDAVSRVPSGEAIMILGDFNAHIGNNADVWKGIIGRHGVPHVNPQGSFLVDFCASNGLAVMNTYFQHKDIHKYTWSRNPGTPSSQKSLIDLVLVSEDLRRSITDVRVMRGADLSTDHFLVVCSIKFKGISLPARQRHTRVVAIRWDKLREQENKLLFNNLIRRKFSEIDPVPDSVDIEWDRFKSTVTDAARQVCGTGLVKARPGRKKSAWWSEDIRGIIKEKKEAFRKWLGSKKEDDRQEYNALKKRAKEQTKVAKREAWRKFGESLEGDFHNANKSFWRTVKRLRKGESSTVHSIKDGSGTLLTETGDILGRWKEYFCELLNPSNEVSEGSQLVDPDIEEVSQEDDGFSITETVAVIKNLKNGKAAGPDELKSDVLKHLDEDGLQWLLRVVNVAWRTHSTPMDWRTGAIVPIFKKGDKRKCENYRGITLLSQVGKVYARLLENRCRAVVDPQLQEEQAGFRRGRGTTDQLFTVQQVIEKCWEYGKTIYAAFLDLEKAYDRVPRDKLWKVLEEYGVRGNLLLAIKSLYTDSSSFVRVIGNKTESFQVQSGLRQGCPLSPILFITYMDVISRKSETPGGLQIGDVTIKSLLFADDVVRVAASESELQVALNKFDSTCTEYGMRVSRDKSEVMIIGRDDSQVQVHLGNSNLKQVRQFKYLGVELTDDGRAVGELDRRLGAASGVLRSLYHSVVRKEELSMKTKMHIFNAVYIPTLTYGHDTWILTERTRSRLQAAEMRFLRGVAGISLRDRVRNTDIRSTLNSEAMLDRVEKSQLRWLGHVVRMPESRLPKKIFMAQPCGRRPVGRPRRRWEDQAKNLCGERLHIDWANLEAVATDRPAWRAALTMFQPRPART